MPGHSRLNSFLYHSSFTFFILLLAALLAGSAWGLGEQAWRTDHQRRWNVFALVATYSAIVFISIIHIWSRVVGVKRLLHTMPKPYVPSKRVDLPKKVANHIATEYSRTAVIAHISQATAGKHEGWGSPGTRWDGLHFRTYILGTMKQMRETLLGDDKARASLNDLVTAAEDLAPEAGKPDPLVVFVASYVSIIERARYARAEPTEADASAVEKVLALVKNLVEVRRQRDRPAEKEKGSIGRSAGSFMLHVPDKHYGSSGSTPPGTVRHRSQSLASTLATPSRSLLQNTPGSSPGASGSPWGHLTSGGTPTVETVRE